MTNETSLARIAEARADAAAGADATTASVGGAVDDGLTLGEAAQNFGLTGGLTVAKFVVDTVKQELESNIAFARLQLRQLEAVDANADAFRAATTNGEFVASIAAVVPGVGNAARRLADALETFDDSARAIASRTEAGKTALRNQIARDERIVDGLDKLSDALGVAIFVASAVATLETAANAAGTSLEEIGLAALEGFSELSYGDVVGGGYSAVAHRYETSTAGISEIGSFFQMDPLAALRAQTETAILPALAAFDRIGDLLQPPLDLAERLSGTGGSFIAGVNRLASPINAVLDFVEDNTSISRNNINALLDFLGNISGFVGFLFERLAGDLLNPINSAINNLLNQALPLNDLSAAFRDVEARLAEAAGLLPDFDGLLDDLANAFEVSVSVDLLDFDAFEAEDGDERQTFFGTDAAEAVTGAALLPETPVFSSGSAGDIARRTFETTRQGIVDEAAANGDVLGAVLSGAGGDDALTGTAEADVLLGGDDDDTLTGGAEADLLSGDEGDDMIDGGAGDDAINGGAGRDVAVFAGLVADYAIGAVGRAVVVEGADGRDELTGIEVLRFDDVDLDASLFAPAEGGAAADVIRRAEGDNTLSGGGGDDTLLTSSGADALSGGEGDDVIRSAGGRDTLTGGAGDDDLRAGAGADVLLGGAGADTLRAGAGRDSVEGGGGRDVVAGGGRGDMISGGGGADFVNAGQGADRAFGGGGGDRLNGAGGADTLGGGRGADTLAGGGGQDVLIGGRGPDVFIFAPGGGADRVRDFTPGQDLLVFTGAGGFADLTVSAVAGDALVSFAGASARMEGVAPGAIDAEDFLF